MKTKRNLRQTLTMIKNQILVHLGFVLINKHGYMVMQYAGEQLRTNMNRRRYYSLDDKGWCILEHSWFMSDDVIMKFMKKGR